MKNTLDNINIRLDIVEVYIAIEIIQMETHRDKAFEEGVSKK